jgi:alpha-galactosidase
MGMLIPSRLSRRALLLGSGSAALAATVPLRSSAPSQSPFRKVTSAPDLVTVFTEGGSVALQREGSAWHGDGIDVTIAPGTDELPVTVRSGKHPLLRLHLRWRLAPPANLEYLGDQWERSYGDLAWRFLEPERVMPWYFIATEGRRTHACGVKTAPGAFCFWQVDTAGISLWLDVRNGGQGVLLGARELRAATIVASSYADISAFAATHQFCRRMCEKPRLPAAPVYGGNNWYYAYGHSSADDIRHDSERIAALATSRANPPFMVIDDGWQPNPTAGPWSRGNARFPDMPRLAAKMRNIGVRPGIWTRPLFTKEQVPAAWQLASPNAEREYSQHQTHTLDSTVPEALAKVKEDVRTLAGWRYELIKHDFSTYDLLGRWGSSMGAAITDDQWHFADRSQTNAEIILSLYRAIREAAGSAAVTGCNTVGHLAAGLFELQRTGDDTSGRDWNRTRKMGVNTLAFRGPQNNAFFAVDADCVGLTKQIPWRLNRQWLDLLAHSGAPLFVSAAPDAAGPEQNAAMRDAFRIAATTLPTGEPLDWLRNNQPEHWRLNGKTAEYNWFGGEGASPFAT